MTWIGDRLYPQLRSFPPEEREPALRSARKCAFDVVELVGIAVGLIVVTLLTRYNAGQWSAFDRIAAFAINFGLALPLLVVFVWPFNVRRIRRGLDEQLGGRARR